MATKAKNERTTAGSSTGAFIGAAAIGVAAGLAANLGRKAMVQGVTAAAGDWMEGLKAEHQATIKIFDTLEKTDTSQVKRRGFLLMQLKHALAKHAFQEENVVYPAMRQNGATEEADSLSHDHAYVKQYLFELTEMPRDNPAWLAKVREFRADLEKHVREEEDILFPRLHEALGDAGNKHVTLAMNKEGFKVA